MYKIVSVILNYKNYNDTLECVKSLFEQNWNNQEIVIVENGSNNESWDILNECYSSNNQIHLIKSDVNLGFAKGNNLGIEYARNILKADSVFVVNSDIVCSNDLFNKVSKYLDNPNLGLINPFVYNLNNEFQLPNVYTNDIYSYIKSIVFKMKRASITTLPIIYTLNRFYHFLKGNKKNTVQTRSYENFKNFRFIVQGCSFFLTNSYLNKYSGLFPNTFLYFEEINLAVYLEKAGLETVMLDTDAYVIHKEAGSSSEYQKNVRKKLRLNKQSYTNSKNMYCMDYIEIAKMFNKADV